jgi:hypothetical protein
MRAQHKGSSPSKPLSADCHRNDKRCRNRTSYSTPLRTAPARHASLVRTSLRKRWQPALPRHNKRQPSDTRTAKKWLGQRTANLRNRTTQLLPSQGRCVSEPKLRSSDNRRSKLASIKRPKFRNVNRILQAHRSNALLLLRLDRVPLSSGGIDLSPRIRLWRRNPDAGNTRRRTLKSSPECN